MAAERESAIIVDMRDLYRIRHINFLIFFKDKFMQYRGVDHDFDIGSVSI